jgi:uncharacterized protein (TIGR03083 family)
MTAAATAPERPSTAPRRPALDRQTAARLAADEYRLFVEQLRELGPDDWRRPTACPAWDVHAMVCHVLGSAEMFGSTVEQMRQLRSARRRGGLFVDALTAVQVEKHVHRSPDELLERLPAAVERAARRRARLPGVMRRRTLAGQPVEPTGTQTEAWTIAYVVDTILTRDTWVHRSDIALATGRSMALTPDHDGVVVADVAAEWAQRHGQPCRLTLSGPAGGSWEWGEGGPALELDAVEFCRTVSGRAPGTGLLATPVPF